MRDAVSRIRADLPPELRDPVIGKPATATCRRDLRGDVDLLDEQSLSWLVDSKVVKALLALPGVGGCAASAASAARCWSNSTRRAWPR